jgi:hypothetical protein
VHFRKPNQHSAGGPEKSWASVLRSILADAMSDIPEDVLDTARAILATIAQSLTKDEIPSMAKLEPREREVLRDAIFQSLDFAYSEGYSDCEMTTNAKKPSKPVQ